LYEGRRIAVSAGSFRDSFAAADVHVYEAVTNSSFLPLIMKAYPKRNYLQHPGTTLE
jgi:hypothetical protein